MMRRSECLTLYGSDYKVQQRVKNGELFQIEKDIFSDFELSPFASGIRKRVSPSYGFIGSVIFPTALETVVSNCIGATPGALISSCDLVNHYQNNL